MKKTFLITGLFILLISSCCFAQDSSSTKKILYKYTFEGMKDSTETIKLEDAVSQLKGVVWVEVIFKSADHKYAQLKTEVMVPEKFNESSRDVTGPSDLKKIISKFGYTPAECKTYNEE